MVEWSFLSFSCSSVSSVRTSSDCGSIDGGDGSSRGSRRILGSTGGRRSRCSLGSRRSKGSRRRRGDRRYRCWLLMLVGFQV